ncbi:MAG TPA: glycoside hydrolase family 28 protein [Puia sp.]|nr:glycoside hydrolase family 28 protein [Puia sp.]
MKTFLTKLLMLYALFWPLFTRAQAPEKTISWYVQHAPFSMQAPELPAIPSRNFSLQDYGGVGDGHTLNTKAFEKAIAACSAAGGGRLTVPVGAWLTGPIELKSNIDLHLERGAMILFTRDHTQYRVEASRGILRTVSPISGYDLENIAITGEGIVDGGGESWRPVKKEKMTAAQWKDLLASGGVLNKEETIWWPSREAMEGKERRPVLVQFNHCKRVLLKEVTLRNSPMYVFGPDNCTDLTMDHVTIFNEWWAQNGDGIDIGTSRNVVIYRCTVSAGDDGICMKSGGMSKDGQAALQNVIIAGCNVYHAHGGFVIGSNTNGGMHRIFVKDCSFIGTDVGLRFKSSMGRGGLVDSIFIQDIHMRDIVHEAVLFDTYYENMPAGYIRDPSKPAPTDKTPEFRDFYISRIYCNGAHTAISITGLPQMPVSRVWFDTVLISSDKGLVASQAKDIDLHDVKLITKASPAYQPDNTAHIIIR